MNKRPIPTEMYPRVLWYQEKRLPCTEEERDILYKKHFDIYLSRLESLFPNSNNVDIKKLAEEKANNIVESEVNMPTVLKKVVVKTAKDHRLTKEMIENSDVFCHWYIE